MPNGESTTTKVASTASYATPKSVRLRLDHLALVSSPIEGCRQFNTLLTLLLLEIVRLTLGSEGIVDGGNASHAGSSFVVNDRFFVLPTNIHTELLEIVRRPQMKSW